jgi:hypothetical protein
MNTINVFQSMVNNKQGEFVKQDLMILCGQFKLPIRNGKIVGKIPTVLELKLIKPTDSNKEFIKLITELGISMQDALDKADKAKTEKTKLKHLDRFNKLKNDRAKIFAQINEYFIDTKFDLYDDNYSKMSIEEQSEFFLQKLKFLVDKLGVFIPNKIRNEFRKFCAEQILAEYNTNNNMDYAKTRKLVTGIISNIRNSGAIANVQTYGKYAYVMSNQPQQRDKYARTLGCI